MGKWTRFSVEVPVPALLGKTPRREIHNQRIRYHVMVTVRRDLVLDSLEPYWSCVISPTSQSVQVHMHIQTVEVE